MSRLFLLRHAKSSWSVPGQADRNRPLNERGQESALAMGRFLRDGGLVPDRILCSPSMRTRQTVAGLHDTCPELPAAEVVAELYEAGAGGYIEAIRRHGASARALMVVGHNPSIEMLAWRLAPEDDTPARRFPTGALAIIDFPDGDWSGLEVGTGRLWQFVRPKDLGVVSED